MVADVVETRLAHIEHRLDEADAERKSQREEVHAISKDVAYLRGALTEIRWTNRAILIGLLGLLVKMAME